MILPILHTFYSWRHRVFVLLWLIYCTWCNILKFHPCYKICQTFIPFYGWIKWHCIYIAHFKKFILLLIDIWIMNNTAMDIAVAFYFSGHIPRSTIAWILWFNFLRRCHTVLYNDHTILKSHQQLHKGSAFLHPHLLLLVIIGNKGFSCCPKVEWNGIKWRGSYD